ncbi:sensor histidine kinase [Asticcacaulis solisilvae]|uniref:sensor histidine kinase n=1 Tax=Asticcacaulis solisilvae TaxID=1217274 RepID=UPI003FD7F3F4
MSLRARILTLVGGFVAMTLVVMLFGLSTISDYNGMMAEYDRAAENAYRGERLNYLISSAVMESRGIYASRNPTETDTYAGRLDRDLDRIEAEIPQWHGESMADLTALEAKTRDFVAVRRDLSKVARAGSIKDAIAIGDRTRQSRMTFQADIERVVADTRTEMLKTRAHADTYRRERGISFAVVTLVWIAVTAGLALWLVSHFITREIDTARREAEAREKLLKELTQSNTELERFAYVASHDMQEPVRMVNIYSQMVLEDYQDAVDERGRKYLRTISAAATRMQAMILDLLAYSRMRNDHEEFSAVDLGDAVRQARGNLARLLDETGARIEAGMLPLAGGNPVQIQRLLENLIGNGIKYQPPGQTAVIHVSAVEAGDRWDITVEDNGIGIDPEFTEKVFEPFRRLHSWEEYPGTGLGLSICRKIAERHGGRIWVEPKPGPGTRVHFTLPHPPLLATPKTEAA